MAKKFGIFGNLKLASVDDIVFDASLQETHRSSARITDHPVESGATISDHVIIDPEELTLSVVVSNTPTVSILEVPSIEQNRAETAYQDLLAKKAARVAVEVTTTLRIYENMILTDVSCTRDANTGNIVMLSLSLREIRTATSATIAGPEPKIDAGKKKKKLGKKPTTPAPAAVAEKANEAAARSSANKLFSTIPGI